MPLLRGLLPQIKSSKCILSSSIAVGVCIYLFIYLLKFYSQTDVVVGLRAAGRSKARPFKNVTILTWTGWYRGNVTSFFNNETQTHCPEYGCRAIGDKNREAEVDAILFHFYEQNMKNAGLPKMRQPHQYYILYLMESPLYPWVRMDAKLFGRFFNLTMTYRVDSDIKSHYVKFHNRSEVSDAENPPPRVMTNDDIRRIVAKKKKFAAWFVSNCNASSQRDLVVKELQKYIPIDVYGKCGTLQCPKGLEECETMLATDYKFYVAFENSACLDYVTEKFRRLRYFVVPLILRESDYRNVAPKGTYIAVDQFPSIKHFAEYLVYLDKTPEAYVKYFQWQETMTVSRHNEFCELCQKLTFGGLPENKVYDDLYDWWYAKSECTAGIGAELVSRNKTG